MKKNIILIVLVLTIIFLPRLEIQINAQEPTPSPISLIPSPAPKVPTTTTIRSNVLCTQIGQPTQEKPAICNLPAGGTVPGAIGAASCPLPGKRVIGCGSFMSDAQYNRGVCSGPVAINRGHCGTNYGCYKGSIEATKNSRRAHSIDVDAQPGETVYLPTISGQSLVWTYQPGMSYSVDPGDGGGFGHVLTADSDAGRWVIHLLHMDPAIIPSKNPGGTYNSGDPITTVGATGYPHLHINIGLNPSDPNGGSGWLDPESLGMCTN